MVYTKRSFKRKAYTKKPTWRKYAGKALMAGGTTGLKVLKKALGLNTETNFVDTSQTTTASNTLTLLSNFITIPQGDTSSTRQGAGVRITHWNMNLIASADPTCTFTQLFRIIAWVQPIALGGTILSAAQIVQTATDFKTFYNMDTSGYKIILDKVVKVNPITVGPNDQAQIDFRYSPLSHELKFTNADTTGAIANVTHGVIRCAVMCLSSVTPPTVAVQHRVFFVDN